MLALVTSPTMGPGAESSSSGSTSTSSRAWSSGSQHCRRMSGACNMPPLVLGKTAQLALRASELPLSQHVRHHRRHQGVATAGPRLRGAYDVVGIRPLADPDGARLERERPWIVFQGYGHPENRRVLARWPDGGQFHTGEQPDQHLTSYCGAGKASRLSPAPPLSRPTPGTRCCCIAFAGMKAVGQSVVKWAVVACLLAVAVFSQLAVLIATAVVLLAEAGRRLAVAHSRALLQGHLAGEPRGHGPGWRGPMLRGWRRGR